MAQTDIAEVDWDEELRRVEAGSLPEQRKEVLRLVLTGLRDMHRKYGILPDSTPGIREDRDRRG